MSPDRDGSDRRSLRDLVAISLARHGLEEWDIWALDWGGLSPGADGVNVSIDGDLLVTIPWSEADLLDQWGLACLDGGPVTVRTPVVVAGSAEDLQYGVRVHPTDLDALLQ